MNRQGGCCGVVLGSTVRVAAARPAATGTRATPRSTTSVFGSSALPRGLFSCPLPFSTLALSTSFFSLFFGAKRLKIFRFLDLPKWLASEGGILDKMPPSLGTRGAQETLHSKGFLLSHRDL